MIQTFSEMLSKLMDRLKRELLVGCIAKIERHDVITMRADIQPLLTYTNKGESKATDFAIIADVPVLFLYAGGYYIRPEYVRGDLVWVSFATHDIENGLRGNADASQGETFSRENAAVVYGLARNNWQAPVEFQQEGLLIGHESGSMSFQLTSNEVRAKADTITIEGNIEVKGNIAQTGDFTTSGNMQAEKEVACKYKTARVALSTHTHIVPVVGESNVPTSGV